MRATHTHTHLPANACCALMMTSPPVSDKHRERESVYPYHIGGGTPSEQKREQLHCFSQKESAVCVHVFVHGEEPCSTVANIAKVPAICIEIACMHALAKIAVLEQLEQYLNDLLPFCFGVRTYRGQFCCPFPTWPFLLALHPLGSDWCAVG